MRKMWSVYGLMVPETSYIAYVGMTSRPKERFSQHRSDPISSAYHLFSRADGISDPVMVIIQDFHTRAEALTFEATLIQAGVGCSNREHSEVRMWRHIRDLLGDEKGKELLGQIMAEARESPDDGLFDPEQIVVMGGYQSKTTRDRAAKAQQEGK